MAKTAEPIEETNACELCGCEVATELADSGEHLCADCIDEPLLCGDCNGSGEGRYDGSSCFSCKGSGEIPARREDEEADDWFI